MARLKGLGTRLGSWRRAPLITLAVFVTMAPPNAVAAERACGESQMEMNRCAKDAAKAADARMNRLYERLMELIIGADCRLLSRND
jgi:uncharacterized protein YecT (DUF1311 family)